MARDRLSTYKTTVSHSDGKTRVTYHSTDIVAWDNDQIVLQSGGWQTVTTKRKMNQAAAQFGLDFSVYQKDFCWYVVKDGKTLDFKDGMIINR